MSYFIYTVWIGSLLDQRLDPGSTSIHIDAYESRNPLQNRINKEHDRSVYFLFNSDFQGS